MNDLPDNIAMVITHGDQVLTVVADNDHKFITDFQSEAIRDWMRYQKGEKSQSS